MTRSFVETPDPPTRRHEILRAALECFSKVGYAQATIEDVRKRSGASVGSIYHHFAGKEQLAASLYIEGLRDYQGSLLAEMETFSTAETMVRGIVRHYINWVMANPELGRFLIEMRRAESVAAAEDEIRSINRRYFQQIGNLFGPFVRAGELVAVPIELYAAIITGPSQELARHVLNAEPKRDLTELQEYLADAAWKAMRPDPQDVGAAQQPEEKGH